MTVETGVNSTSPNTVKWATSDTDPFERETHLRGPVENFDLHDHSNGKNLAIKRIQSGTFAARPAAGNAGHVYVATNTAQLFFDTGAAWVEPLVATLADAKGDLFAGTAADAIARLAVGANDTFLQADSAEATGLKWGGIWTDFTPTLTQNGGAVAATITYARYAKIGKTALVQVRFAATGAGAAGIIRVASIPAAIAPARFDNTGVAPCGVGLVKDVSTGAFYAGVASFENATTLYIWPGDAGATAQISGAFALASGDFVGVNLSYELA